MVNQWNVHIHIQVMVHCMRNMIVKGRIRNILPVGIKSRLRLEWYFRSCWSWCYRMVLLIRNYNFHLILWCWQMGQDCIIICVFKSIHRIFCIRIWRVHHKGDLNLGWLIRRNIIWLWQILFYRLSNNNLILNKKYIILRNNSLASNWRQLSKPTWHSLNTVLRTLC